MKTFDTENPVTEQSAVSTDRRSTSWDVRNASRNYVSLVAAQVTTASFSLAAVWLLTRYIGAEGYGNVVAVLLAGQLAQIPIVWTGNALSRFGVEEFVKTGNISRAFWSRTLIFVPNLILVAAAYPLWVPPLAGWLKIGPELYPLLLLNFASFALTLHVQAALQAAKLVRLQSLLTVIERVSIFVILAGLAFDGRLSIAAALLSYAVPPLLIGAFGLWRLRPFISSWSFDASTVKRIVIFSLPIPLYAALSHLTFNHLDAIFILRYMTAADLGIYSVAYQLNGWVVQLAVLVGFLAMPLLVTSETEGADNVKVRYFRDVLPLITFSFGAAALSIATVGYVILPSIFSSTFEEVGALLMVFAAACTFTVPIQAGLLPFAYARSKTYIQLVAAVAAAVANIVFDVLLIPRYGLAGCVWASVISCGLNLLVFSAIFRKKLGLPIGLTLAAGFPTLVSAAIFSLTESIVFAWISFGVVGSLLLVTRGPRFLASVKTLIRSSPIKGLSG